MNTKKFNTKQPKNPPLGLYLHLAFCAKKCEYCDFYSVVNGEDVMDSYTDALVAHMTETAPFTKRHLVDTVYLGGGTPTLLGETRLVRLLKTVKKHYRLAKRAEITIEANPESAQDWKMLRALRRAGCNRISLGMQAGHDDTLRSLGRIHSVEQVTTAVAAIRKAKINNLSLDLMYGLPGQTPEQWRETLALAVSLQPEHLSCYGLKVEERTPLFQRKDTLSFPDDDQQAELYLYTVDYLAQQGYGQYEISNFAKEGYASRHNLKYWTLGEYAGFGPSAHSDLGGVRYAYPRDLQGYIQGVQSGAPLVSESTAIPPQDRDTEWVMLGLRTVQGLCPKDYETKFRRKFDCFLPFLQQCKDAGYAVEEDDRWHLTPRGFLVSNQIIGELLELQHADKSDPKRYLRY